jgi:hypothetical protein
LQFWQAIAAAFLAMDDRLVTAALAANELTEINCHGKSQKT